MSVQYKGKCPCVWSWSFSHTQLLTAVEEYTFHFPNSSSQYQSHSVVCMKVGWVKELMVERRRTLFNPQVIVSKCTGGVVPLETATVARSLTQFMLLTWTKQVVVSYKSTWLSRSSSRYSIKVEIFQLHWITHASIRSHWSMMFICPYSTISKTRSAWVIHLDSHIMWWWGMKHNIILLVYAQVKYFYLTHPWGGALCTGWLIPTITWNPE